MISIYLEDMIGSSYGSTPPLLLHLTLRDDPFLLISWNSKTPKPHFLLSVMKTKLKSKEKNYWCNEVTNKGERSANSTQNNLALLFTNFTLFFLLSPNQCSPPNRDNHLSTWKF